MTADNPRLGIVLMLGFCLFAPLGDGFVKLLGASLPLVQVVFVRFAAPVLLLLPARLWHTRQINARILPWIVLRAVLHLVSISLFFLSLRHLPLADALAIAYILPFLILLVGWLTGDKVRPVQLGLVIVGFAGALMVVQPSFAKVGWPALLPLGVAFSFVGFMFITRRIAQAVDPIDLQVLNGIVICALLVPILYAGTQNGWAEAQIASATPKQAFYLLCIGVTGTVAHLSMTYCLKVTKPTTVAPVQYLEIPCGAVFGLLMFGDIPNGLAALGIVTVMAAGLLVILTTPKA